MVRCVLVGQCCQVTLTRLFVTFEHVHRMLQGLHEFEAVLFIFVTYHHNSCEIVIGQASSLYRAVLCCSIYEDEQASFAMHDSDIVKMMVGAGYDVHSLFFMQKP